MFLVVLFSVRFMCSFHVKCCCNRAPRNLIDSSVCISELFQTIRFGRQRGVSSFLLGIWNIEYFVFSKFKDSLFAMNQSLMFYSSIFPTVAKCPYG